MNDFKIKGTFEIIVRGQAVKVEYDGITYGIVIHFSFYGNGISSSGYRSYFLNTDEYIREGYTDYKLCAQDIAEFLYKDRQEEIGRDRVIREQLSLF